MLALATRKTLVADMAYIEADRPKPLTAPAKSALANQNIRVPL